MSAITLELPRTRKRVAFAATVAAAAEWYDYLIFGIASALVFGPVFFPSGNAAASVAAAFATFAVGFIARPIGGVIAGHYGDRVGRKPVLVAALVCMGIATLLIGLLPSYSSTGIAAPIALAALRFIQGAAVGAQWGGAMLLATEYAPANRRGLYGGLVQLGVPLGLVAANVAFLAATAIAPGDQLLAWGWRLPFLAGFVVIGLAVFIHRTVEDTPAFRATTPDRSPLRAILRQHKRTLLLASGAFTVVSATYYVLITGTLDYATRVLGVPRQQMLIIVVIIAVAQFGLLPLFAALSDSLGRLRVYAIGATATLIWAVPMFKLIDTGRFGPILLGLLVGTACLSLMYGPQAALFTELFGTRVRYTGASLGYQIGSLAGGAIAPIAMVGLLESTGKSMSVAVYIIVLAVVALACLAAIARHGHTTTASDSD